MLKVLIAAKAERGGRFLCLLFLEIFTNFGKYYFHDNAYENQNSYNLTENNWKVCAGLFSLATRVFCFNLKS